MAGRKELGMVGGDDERGSGCGGGGGGGGGRAVAVWCRGERLCSGTGNPRHGGAGAAAGAGM